MNLPNYGLYPEVRSVQPADQEEEVDDVTFMQLTNAEHRRLQERGVPENMIRRVEHLFNQMDRMQDQGLGGESRWSVGCLRERLVDGIDALEALHEVISRRFLPRSFFPIRRVPRGDG